MQPNEPSKQRFPSDLHISAAVLDVEALTPNAKKGAQLWIEHHGNQTLIANLCRQASQCVLDIGFSKNEEVIFSIKGQGVVHLHGYFAPDDEIENVERYNILLNQRLCIII